MIRFKYTTPLAVIVTLMQLLVSCASIKNYDIKIESEKLQAGDTLYLNAYKGQELITLNKIAIDTNQSIAHFTGNLLNNGMYAINSYRYTDVFPFLISHKQPQSFSVTPDFTNSQKPLVFNNSKENTLFYQYLYGNNSADSTIYRQYPMLSLIIKMNDYPDNKADYWNNIDFGDEQTARNPFFPERLYFYFFHVIGFSDENQLKLAVDDVLNKAQVNADVYEVTAEFLYNLFIGSPIPGNGDIAKYIANNYILGGYTSVFDSAFISQIKSEINWVSKNPVGSISPDIKLKSIAGDYLLLSNINAKATILYFYDPDCGNCIKISPQLSMLYKKYKPKGLEVCAVYVGYEENIWKSYVISNKLLDWINVWSDNKPEVIYNNYSLMGLPTIYLLDENKRIIAKDILFDDLENMLNQLLD